MTVFQRGALALSAGLLIAVPAGADDKKPLDDKTFVQKAVSGGMFEVKASQLAERQATREDVKKFAQQMTTDHTKVNDELKALATRKGWQVPTEMLPKHKEILDKLTSAGSDFDRTYIKAQVDGHQEAVKCFEECVKSVTDADLKAFAEKHLPTLKEHLRMAQQLQTERK